MRFTRITVIKTQTTPDHHDINELLQWLGGSLGLFNQRDKDRSCYRIFLVLLKDLKGGKRGLTSDELALATKLSRGTAVHHLNRLMEAGIVSTQRGRYALSVDTLEALVQQVRENVDKTFISIKEVANYIDEQLDL